VIALIVLGPDKLPKVARQLGAGWRQLAKFREKVEREMREAMPDVDLPRIPTSPRAAVAGFLNDLTAPLAQPLETTDATGGEAADMAAGTTAKAPAPAGSGPSAVAARSRPLALEHPLVAPDDPSMN
jgi:Sec-independent protein translocase protein TatA